jgi:hypothetical protein
MFSLAIEPDRETKREFTSFTPASDDRPVRPIAPDKEPRPKVTGEVIGGLLAGLGIGWETAAWALDNIPSPAVVAILVFLGTSIVIYAQWKPLENRSKK